MPTAQLSAGPIDYVDTGGPGPVLVLTHGVPMSPTQWRRVVPLLGGCRCILPTLPLGGHRRPMHPGSDLSQRGQAWLLAELVAALGLEDVTLVVNDWGGAQFAVLEPGGERISRLVLVACEAFDNFPPPPARALAVLARIPGGMWLLTRLIRVRAFRRARSGWGGMSLRGVPDEIVLDWFAPATRSAAIRADLAAFCAAVFDRDTLLGWAEEMRSFAGPVLVVWADQDSMMPREHGPRLAAWFSDAELVRVPESSTLVPEDQPDLLAGHLRRFLTRTGAPPAESADPDPTDPDPTGPDPSGPDPTGPVGPRRDDRSG